MHRTQHLPVTRTRGLFVALVLGLVAPGLAPAQEARPAPAPTLIVPINQTQRLQMSQKQIIAKGVNRTEAVVRLAPAYGDPTTLLVTGLEPGIARITLIDQNNREENFEVIVQLDVEYLKTLIRRAVPTANVEPLPAANSTVVLRGSVARAEDIEVITQIAQSVVGNRVINGLRVGGVQQVQLCVVVAQVSRSDFRRLAFNFLINGTDYFVGSTVGGAATVGQLGFGGLNAGLGAPNGAPTNAFFGILNHGTTFLGFLQALNDENVTKLLAEPRLVAMSGRAASFVSGGEQAIPVPAGLGQIGVQFEEFGTRLNFLPIVLGNGRIHLEVEPEVSQLNQAFGVAIQGTVVPGRTTQRVHTTVEIEPGQTLVIGGLIQRNSTGAITKVPVLGDLPYIGAAFSSKNFTELESELVVLVTPHLVDPMSPDQLPKYLPGMETRSPDDFELFLEGILEAPRGQRNVRVGHGSYVPAYKHSPTAGTFPCLDGNCAANGSCTTSHPASVTPTTRHDSTPHAQAMPAAPATPAVTPAGGTVGESTLLPASERASQPEPAVPPVPLPPLPGKPE